MHQNHCNRFRNRSVKSLFQITAQDRKEMTQLYHFEDILIFCMQGILNIVYSKFVLNESRHEDRLKFVWLKWNKVDHSARRFPENLSCATIWRTVTIYSHNSCIFTRENRYISIFDSTVMLSTYTPNETIFPYRRKLPYFHQQATPFNSVNSRWTLHLYITIEMIQMVPKNENNRLLQCKTVIELTNFGNFYVISKTLSFKTSQKIENSVWISSNDHMKAKCFLTNSYNFLSSYQYWYSPTRKGAKEFNLHQVIIKSHFDLWGNPFQITKPAPAMFQVRWT